MCELAYQNTAYVVVRFVLFTVLLLFALGDRFLRQQRPNNSKLQLVITGGLGLYELREICTLAWVVPGDDATSAFRGALFFSTLSDSFLLFLLLLLACGWCITRIDIPEKGKVFGFPAIYFVATVVHNFILDGAVGHNTSDSGVQDGQPYISDSTLRLVDLIAAFASLFFLFYSWYWVFSMLALERERLTRRIAQAEGSAAPQPTAQPAPAADAEPQRWVQVSLSEGADSEGEGQFQEVAPPSPMGPSEAQPAPPESSDTQPMFDADDAEDTAIPDKAKLRMLIQFAYAVQLYLLSVVIVLFLQIWRRKSDTVSCVVLDLLDLALLSALTFTFRLQRANPYFLLDDFDGSFDNELVEMDELGDASRQQAPAGAGSDSPPASFFSISDEPNADEDNVDDAALPAAQDEPPAMASRWLRGDHTDDGSIV